MFYRLINNIFLQAFSLVKYNLVLFIPFFLFLLVTGFVLLPLSSKSGGPSVFYILLFIIPALLAVFLSGWLNMFKACVEATTDGNLAESKRTEDSFLLFKEFFPGVEKYFVKIALGILNFICLFLLFNLFMRILEMVIISLLGGFDSFSQYDLWKYMSNAKEASTFWDNISSSDRIKIYKIAGLEALITLCFFYLTMFWIQILVIQEIYPIKALRQSFRTVIKDPVSTLLIFISGISSILLVIFVSAILSINPLIQLLSLILFVFVLIYFLMLTFIYLEKYGIQEKINSNSRPDSLEQD